MSTNEPAGTKKRAKPVLKPIRVISVTSGKGGVGKTNVVANLALALTRAGKKVVVWDADLGLANVDVLLGLKPEFNIHHLLVGEKTLKEIMVEGPGGMRVIPASSGIQNLASLGEGEKLRLLAEFDEFKGDLDFLLIDTGAGIGNNVMYFNVASQERIIVVTPEPTSITDAYAMFKVMSTKYNQKKFGILPNQVTGSKEARRVYELLCAVADQHLGSLSLDYLGYIPKDDFLTKAVRQQKAVLEAYPSSEASQQFTQLAKTIIGNRAETETDGRGFGFFWKRILKM
jgi:flagellar biosynthesis protein FlhG